MSDNIKLSISGMTCNHCVARAKKALKAVAGVDSVEVTLEPGAALVKGSMAVVDLIAAVKAVGYEAKAI